MPSTMLPLRSVTSVGAMMLVTVPLKIGSPISGTSEGGGWTLTWARAEKDRRVVKARMVSVCWMLLTAPLQSRLFLWAALFQKEKRAPS
jgi:hypothetical protein